MKQVIQDLKGGGIKVIEVPTPALRENGLLVENRYSLISSGTERMLGEFAGKSLLMKAKSRPDLAKQVINKAREDGPVRAIKRALNKLDEGIALGYSSAGIVLETALGVTVASPGDYLACAGGGYACHAERVFVPKNLAVKLPDNVELKDAAFGAVGAVALEGIRRGVLAPGDTVAVIGLGLVGRLTVEILNAYGHPVFGIDIDEVRSEMAKSCGLLVAPPDYDAAIAFIQEITSGYGVDVTIVAASTKSDQPVSMAADITRQRGRVVVVGDVGMQVPRKPFYYKELDLSVSRSYGPGRYDSTYEEMGVDYPFPYVRWTERRNMEEFIRLISDGKIKPSDLACESYLIEQASDAYSQLSEGKSDVLAILLSYMPKETDDFKTDIVKITPLLGNKKDEIGLGLIGGGNFVRATLLPILGKVDGAKLRAIATASGRTAADLASKYGMEYATSDYTRLLEDENIDLVVVATRHNLHTRIALDCVEAGKCVHIEKPLALNMEELSLLAGGLTSKEGWVCAGFNRKEAPLITEMEDFMSTSSGPIAIQYQVAAGTLPHDHWIYDPVEGGGRIIGEACHFVDLLVYLMGGEPESIHAYSADKVDEMERIENVYITIKHKDGSLGAVQYLAMGGALPKERMEVSRGQMSVLLDDYKSEMFFNGSKRRRTRLKVQDKGHRALLEKEIDAVRNGKEPPRRIEDSLLSNYVTLLALEAIRSNTNVKIEFKEFLRGTRHGR